MKHVMLDFETLATSPNAAVIQVGACYFDADTGEIGATFKRNVDAKSAVKSGAIIDPNTVMWWLEQSEVAQNSILAFPREDINLVFSDLNAFLQGAECIWSHATFDFVILTETLSRLAIRPNFSFRATKDIRTLQFLVKRSSDKTESKLVRNGVHHDALDDCKFQVAYVVEALKRIDNVKV